MAFLEVFQEKRSLNQMRVLIVDTINNIPSHKQFQSLAKELVEKGHEVIHLSDSKRTDYNGVKVYHYSNARRINAFLLFLRIFRNFKPVLVISTFRGNQYIDLFSWFFPFKWFAFLQSDFFHQKLYNKWRFRKVTRLFVLSSPLVSRTSNMYPHVKQKITVIPNSFEFQNIQIHEKKDVILHVGGAVKNASQEFVKGTDTLIKAFQKWQKDTGAKVELWIVGDGPYLEELKQLAIATENIFFKGRLSHNEVMDCMKQSKVFVLPSRNDAFPNVFLEAMNNGCSLIGTEGTGAVDIIEEGRFGVLVPQEDVDALAIAIHKIYSNFDQEKVYMAYQGKRVQFSRENWVSSMIFYISSSHQ